MLDRFKTALVDSFAGAIVLGILVAEGIQRVAYIFSEPVIRWLLQRFQEQQISRNSVVYQFPPRFPFEMAIPELFTALFLLGASYVLLRWLYFPPAEKQDQEETPEPEQGA
jgi:hypothetical protein